MAALTDYLSRRGEILVLILVCVLSVGLTMMSRNAKSSVARSLNDAAMAPVQGFLARLQGVTGTQAENDELRTALVEAQLRIAELDETSRAAQRLEAMLAFRDRSGFGLVAGRVIAHEAGRMGRELKIDKGSRDGVQKNFAVITTEGLVGKVSAVEPLSCYVRPITSRQCRVSARIRRTRTEGILEWTPDRGLHLEFLPFRAEVAVGDEIVSSGLGGVYPGGVPIGTVESVETDPAVGSLRVTVNPAQVVGQLEEVFVVTAADGSPSGFFAADSVTADSLAAADSAAAGGGG